MNRKGQALIEFVLILPVLIFILFAVIDFGMIFSTKNTIENDSLDIVTLFKNGTSIDEIKKIYNENNIKVSNDGEYYTFKITASVNLITPGLNKILGDPYIVNIERIIPYA